MRNCTTHHICDCLSRQLHRLKEVEKRAEKLADEASLFERAATAEMNEKGAGGYALARLTDLRSALEEYRKDAQE